MTALQILGVIACLVAAITFGLRARFLGNEGEGWPSAPWRTTAAMDLVVIVFFVRAADLFIRRSGIAIEELLLASAVAVYGLVLLINLLVQRDRRPRPVEHDGVFTGP